MNEPLRPFPSLRITASGLEPRGPFAEAQAAFLRPDERLVARLDAALAQKSVGVVAHFYMDPELQGVLAACTHPHIHVSDSLVMADQAVSQARAGMRRIVVLGVDFMSENARAMLDAAGLEQVPVYRVAADPIGCSLAEAAEAAAYDAYLTRAGATPHALHVVYINTSLRTKAHAHTKVPTITCTSSNVVATVLSAAAAVPDIRIFFGPDTYMGRNIATMLETLGRGPDEVVRKLHPAHDAASVRALRERFTYFDDGACVVHHMFGHEVVERVRSGYADAFVTAHLEVPGEMFALGLAGQADGRGVVGSTSEILRFIETKVDAACVANQPAELTFILGTEAGMITPVVRKVEARLHAHRQAGGAEVVCDIVFPVASEAIARTDDPLAIVPGVPSGEGCTTAGGCATCPYMKMNSLEALFDLLDRLDVAPPDSLAAYHPKLYLAREGGPSIAALGSVPILHMREFQRDKAMPKALVDDVLTRTASL
jgi:quinolinate synthase